MHMPKSEELTVIAGHMVKIIKKNGLRRIAMKMDSRGTICVSAPSFTSDKDIISMIEMHQDWIMAQQLRAGSKKRMPEDGAYLFGTWHSSVMEHVPEKPSGCYLEDEVLHINTLQLNDDWAEANKLFTRFIKSVAAGFLPPRLEAWAAKMQITYNKITLREQSSRWGSCSSTGSINLNWRLVHAPTAVIDYVLIHELAHRVHLDHSQRFWHLVEQYDPEYRIHRGWLKREGAQLTNQ